MQESRAASNFRAIPSTESVSYTHLMATGNTPIMDWNIFNGMRTLSANIATELPEAAQDLSLIHILLGPGTVGTPAGARNQDKKEIHVRLVRVDDSSKNTGCLLYTSRCV